MEIGEDDGMGLVLVHSRSGDRGPMHPDGLAGSRDLFSIIDAAAPAQITVALTAAGALAAVAVQLLYAFYSQGWGAALP